MGDWVEDNKDAGPSGFNFIEQGDKFGYINNPKWSEKEGAQNFSNNRDLPLDPSTHIPCGHWHKRPLVAVDEDVYITHGAPIITGSAEQDWCRKRNKDLVQLTAYGGIGTGIDQLRCCFGICVSEAYVWICDVRNKRLMQRRKSDLSYVQHRDSFTRDSCHTDGENLWVGDTYVLNKVDINTLTTLITIDTTSDTEAIAKWAYDITCDLNYLYVADNWGYRVIVYNKLTLEFVGEVGVPLALILNATGVWTDGIDIFVADYGTNQIKKLTLATWTLTLTVGHINGGSGSNYTPYPNGIFGYGTNLYIALLYEEIIQIRKQSDLTYVDEVACSDYPWDVFVNASYIYVSESSVVTAYDISSPYTQQFQSAGMSQCVGICADATHLYVVDEFDNTIYKLLLTDLSYVDDYADPGYANMLDPMYCAVDGTYVYVSDQSLNVIHRINKATMAYVDSFGAGLYAPQKIYIDGTDLFISNYSTDGIHVYDLTTLTKTDQSPAETPYTDYALNSPLGITCDRDFIYVANNTESDESGDSEIVVFTRSGREFVRRHTLAYNVVEHIAVDDNYLYAAFWNATLGDSFVVKYDKSTMVEQEIQSDHLQYTLSVDTWYPWYKPDHVTGGDDLSDEPQVWPLP